MDIFYFINLFTKHFRKRRGMNDLPPLHLVEESFKALKPQYYNLVSLIIKKANVYFKLDYETFNTYQYNKRKKEYENLISLREDIFPFSLFHELGHSFDSFNGVFYASNSFITSFAKGLNEIVLEELNKSKEELLDRVLEAFQYELDKEEGETSYKLLMSYNELILKRNALSISEHDTIIPNTREYSIYRLLNKNGSLDKTEHYDDYLRLTKYIRDNKIASKLKAYLNTKAYKYINNKYLIIIDLLSAKYDMSKLYLLEGHDISYYRSDPSRLSSELFANFIGCMLIGNNEAIEVFKDLLPNSYKGLIEAYNNQVRLISK